MTTGSYFVHKVVHTSLGFSEKERVDDITLGAGNVVKWVKPPPVTPVSSSDRLSSDPAL